MTVQKTTMAACSGAAGSGGTGGAAGSGGSAGAGATGGDMGASEYGATLNNAEGDDDDCKYHVNFTSSDIYENKDITFTVTVTKKDDGAPATAANPDIEAFLNDVHPAPNSEQKATEKGKGVYDIGPMQFDAPGKWTVRFHLYEECSDASEESPHGHVAFFIDVP